MNKHKVGGGGCPRDSMFTWVPVPKCIVVTRKKQLPV